MFLPFYFMWFGVRTLLFFVNVCTVVIVIKERVLVAYRILNMIGIECQ